MDKNINKLINKLTKESPYFKKFNQKRYSKIKGYIEHDTVLLNLARCLISYSWSDADYFTQNLTHATTLIILDKIYREDFNSYWLAPDLLNAFTKTKLPDNLDHLKQVIPAGLLMLPPIITNPDGQLLKWVVFYHRLAHERIPPINLSKESISIAHDDNDTLTWATMLDDGSQYSGNITIKDYNLEEANDFFFIHDIYKDTDKTTEKQFTDLVTGIILQTILYLQLKPEEIKPKSSHTSPKQKGKNQKLSPLIIGNNYRYKTETGEGTGGTKTTHWRRGFYRWQPYGIRENPEYKLIWIEPTLVNGGH